MSLERLETTGEPFLIDKDGSEASLADDGTLLYVRGAGVGTQQLVWVTLQGEVGEAIGQPQTAIMKPAISPDGRRVAVMGLENESWDIWVHDAGRGTHTRLTFDSTQDWDPVWTPDGENIIFWEGTRRALLIKSADGGGDPKRLFEKEFLDYGEPHLSPDGRHLVFWARDLDRSEDIWVFPLQGEEEPVRVISTPAVEEYPRISPDGRFLVYSSNESGRSEIYMNPFPDVGKGKWQVSVNGGTEPRWAADGKVVFFSQGTSIMTAGVDLEPVVQIETPRQLFGREIPGISVLDSGMFDAAPDGDRLVMIRSLVPEGKAPSLMVVQNWASEFQQAD